jgi:hypothetical protein
LRRALLRNAQLRRKKRRKPSTLNDIKTEIIGAPHPCGVKRKNMVFYEI